MTHPFIMIAQTTKRVHPPRLRGTTRSRYSLCTNDHSFPTTHRRLAPEEQQYHGSSSSSSDITMHNTTTTTTNTKTSAQGGGGKTLVSMILYSLLVVLVLTLAICGLKVAFQRHILSSEPVASSSSRQSTMTTRATTTATRREEGPHDDDDDDDEALPRTSPIPSRPTTLPTTLRVVLAPAFDYATVLEPTTVILQSKDFALKDDKNQDNHNNYNNNDEQGSFACSCCSQTEGYFCDEGTTSTSTSTTTKTTRTVNPGYVQLPSSPGTRQRQRPVSAVCAICLSPYQPGDSISWSPLSVDCRHAFHTHCIVPYAETCYTAQAHQQQQVSLDPWNSNPHDSIAHPPVTVTVPCPCCRTPFLQHSISLVLSS